MAVDFGTKKSESIVQTVYESFIYRYEELTNTVFIGTKKGKIKSFYKWDGREDNMVIEVLREVGLL